MFSELCEKQFMKSQMNLNTQKEDYSKQRPPEMMKLLQTHHMLSPNSTSSFSLFWKL